MKTKDENNFWSLPTSLNVNGRILEKEEEERLYPFLPTVCASLDKWIYSMDEISVKIQESGDFKIAESWIQWQINVILNRWDFLMENLNNGTINGE